MKILVIGSKSWGKKNDPTVIAKTLSSSNKLSADLCFWEDITLDIKTNDVRVFNRGESILDKKYDLAICLGWYKNGGKSIYRDLALSVAKIFDKNGIKYWNSDMGRQRSTTKLSQMVIMALNGIHIPRTRFALDTTQFFTENIKSEFDLQDNQKYIVKATSASRGANNYCVDNLEKAHKILADDENYYLLQDFLPNDHDLRIICFDGRAKLALKRSRQSNNTHLNNTSQGGKADWIELTPKISATAEKVSRLLGCEMGGVDLIEVKSLDKEEKIYYYCLEINAIPQLTSGTDSDFKMKTLLESLSEE